MVTTLPGPDSSGGHAPAARTAVGGPDRTPRWERHLPLAGFAAAALFVLGFVVSAAGQPPRENAPSEEVAAFFVTGGTSVLLTQFVLALAVLFLLVFLASLFDCLRETASSPLFARLGFASGVGAAILMLASSAPHLAAVWASESRGSLSPAAAETLWHLPSGIFNLAYLPTAVMMIMIAYLTFRTGLLPRWFGGLTAGAALVLLVPFIGWGIFPPLLAVWVLVATLPVWRTGMRRPSAAVRDVRGRAG
jgi:hypothetical protein